MQEVKLTHAVLIELKKDHYIVLLSDCTADDDDPTFISEFKADICG